MAVVRSSLVLALILSALALTVGCAETPGDPADALRIVEVDLGAVDPDVARRIGELVAAASESPEDGGARGRLAMTYETNGFADAALQSYRQAIRLDAANPRWSYFAAQQTARAGDLEAALVQLEAARRQAPGEIPLSLRRGQWLLDLGRDEEAAATYREVLQRRPEPAATIGLARAELNLERADVALQLLEPLADRVRHPYVQQLLARAYRQAGDTARARAVLEGAGPPQAAPGWRDPWNEEKAAFRTGFSAGLIGAERLVRQGKLDAAVAELERLRAERPDDVSTLNNLSVVYLRTRRIAEARAVLEDAVRRHPDYFPFHLNLAELYRQAGERERALGHLEQAIRLNPTLAHAHQQRGDLLMSMGRLEEGRASFSRAMLYDAGSSMLYLRAAMLESRAGDFDETIRLARLALDLDGNNGNAWLLLSGAEAARGDFAAAETALTRASAAGVPSRNVEAARARIRAMRGDG